MPHFPHLASCRSLIHSDTFCAVCDLQDKSHQVFGVFSSLYSEHISRVLNLSYPIFEKEPDLSDSRCSSKEGQHHQRQAFAVRAVRFV